MVNAYVYENHTVFGQLKVDDKSNEITAIGNCSAKLASD